MPDGRPESHCRNPYILVTWLRHRRLHFFVLGTALFDRTFISRDVVFETSCDRLRIGSRDSAVRSFLMSFTTSHRKYAGQIRALFESTITYLTVFPDRNGSCKAKRVLCVCFTSLISLSQTEGNELCASMIVVNGRQLLNDSRDLSLSRYFEHFTQTPTRRHQQFLYLQ